MIAPFAPFSTRRAVACSIRSADPVGKEKTRMYPTFRFSTLTMCALIGGTSICWRMTVNSSGSPCPAAERSGGRAVPCSPLISASDRSNDRLCAAWPSIRTITSPGRIPASRAGPLSADVTMRPFRAGPTVSPIPE